MKQLCSTLSLIALVAAATPAAHAEIQVPIDDFKTGPYQSPPFKAGNNNTAFQTGAMMGGRRDEGLLICDTTVAGQCATANPFNQSAAFAIRASATNPKRYLLIHSAGYDLGPRLEVDYGFGAPMSQNFSNLVDQGGTGRIRLNFDGLSETLNFNVLLYSSNGHYAQSGCNMPQHNGPFGVELAFNKFIHDSMFTFVDVSHIVLIFQSSSTIGTVNFGIGSVEASDTQHGDALQCFIPMS